MRSHQEAAPETAEDRSDEEATKRRRNYCLAVGETVVDLVADDEAGVFRARFGGAPLNVAVAVARLGGQAGLMTMFGLSDMFGRRTQTFLEAEGVDVINLAATDNRTPIAVATQRSGVLEFTGYGLASIHR